MSPETIADALAAAAACRAAERSGLLAALADTPLKVAPDRLGLDPRLTGALMDVLGALGLADQDGSGAWRVDPATVRAVKRAVGLWDQLEPALRSGRTAIRSDDAELAAAGYPEVVADLEAMWGSAPRLLAEQLRGVGRCVLDLGAGTGAWSRALLEADPTRRAVAVDLAPVLEVTAGVLKEAGMIGRMDLTAADLLSDPLPAGCDLVVLANVCHLFGTDVLARLFGRVEAVAAPGATVAVVDLFGDEPPLPSAVALYALGLSMRTEAGRLHSFATYARLLHEAGLGHLERIELDARLSAVVAHKPAGDGSALPGEVGR